VVNDSGAFTSLKLGRLGFRRAGREPSEKTNALGLELDGVAFTAFGVGVAADRQDTLLR
jgi:hypothetical protein